MGIYLFQNALAPVPKLAQPTLATLKTDRTSLPAPSAKAFTSKIVSSVTIYCRILLSGSEKPHGKSQCYTC